MTQLASLQTISPCLHTSATRRIAKMDSLLCQKFSDSTLVDATLTRKIVSFQANKMRPMYRLYKYKEAFSADLIEYLVSRYAVKSPVLDCFAGAGTTLFSCADLGLSADGVEILPVGKICFEGRQELRRASKKTINALQPWKSRVMWEKFPASQLNTLRISANAYPPQTVADIGII